MSEKKLVVKNLQKKTDDAYVHIHIMLQILQLFAANSFPSTLFT